LSRAKGFQDGPTTTGTPKVKFHHLEIKKGEGEKAADGPSKGSSSTEWAQVREKKTQRKAKME